MQLFNWTRRGGYEVSSKGDRRFSAYYARVETLGGHSIEVLYQCTPYGKNHDPVGLDPRKGKGKPPNNDKTKDELWSDYLNLWVLWAAENIDLIFELYELAQEKDYVLSDCFANTDHNQARALATILNAFFNEVPLK